MAEITEEWMRLYVEGWREVNRITDAERRERLRNMSDEECFAAMRDVLAFHFPDLPERGSGLVEFQRALHGRR